IIKKKNLKHIFSNEIIISYKNQNPLQPSLRQFNKNDDQNYLSWEEYGKDVKNYLIYRQDEEKGFFQYKENTDFLDKKIEKDKEYTYYIWAFNKYNSSSTPLIITNQVKEDLGMFSVNKNKKTVIEYKNLKLEIPKGAAYDESIINIKPISVGKLRKVPNSIMFTDIESINSYVAYDITLNNNILNQFDEEISITFQYDTALLNESNKNDIFIHYYDEYVGDWKYLKRDALDIKNNSVTSKVKHFCQFYVGSMNVDSEPAQAKGINTKPMNIKNVDPMEGIKNIEAPKPNNQGTANIKYPIDVPEGINKLTPELSINYSSEVREGNCGYGWNFAVSSIQIGTKDGVPKYDGNDTLLLDGKELIKINSTTYRVKNEGSFNKIIKNGSYYIVYNTNGNIQYYGYNDNSRLYDPDNLSKIYQWFLTKTVDKFGNEINYTYQIENHSGKRSNLYLSQITYGYNNNSYSVDFSWENRDDIRTSYRSGFRINNNKRLTDIVVSYNSTELKKERLFYNYNAHNKSILEIIREAVNEEVINEQNFEYELSVNNTFNSPTRWISYNGWGDGYKDG
ncbi:MAG: hypothetical protein KAT05_14575, partial [Spirochaetes bacterium]|nr:hypothetical protein [Spirochaetota bacterium]